MKENGKEKKKKRFHNLTTQKPEEFRISIQTELIQYSEGARAQGQWEENTLILFKSIFSSLLKYHRALWSIIEPGLEKQKLNLGGSVGCPRAPSRNGKKRKQKSTLSFFHFLPRNMQTRGAGEWCEGGHGLIQQHLGFGVLMDTQKTSWQAETTTQRHHQPIFGR